MTTKIQNRIKELDKEIEAINKKYKKMFLFTLFMNGPCAVAMVWGMIYFTTPYLFLMYWYMLVALFNAYIVADRYLEYSKQKEIV